MRLAALSPDAAYRALTRDQPRQHEFVSREQGRHLKALM